MNTDVVNYSVNDTKPNKPNNNTNTHTTTNNNNSNCPAGPRRAARCAGSRRSRVPTPSAPHHHMLIQVIICCIRLNHRIL